MTWTELGAQLNALNVPGTAPVFAHFGWSSAPAGDYGVYAEERGRNILTGDNRNAERAVSGYVDWFTRTDAMAVPDAIEAKFKELQETNVLAWYLNTVQYEADTHFLHYEWLVELG